MGPGLGSQGSDSTGGEPRPGAELSPYGSEKDTVSVGRSRLGADRGSALDPSPTLSPRRDLRVSMETSQDPHRQGMQPGG